MSSGWTEDHVKAQIARVTKRNQLAVPVAKGSKYRNQRVVRPDLFRAFCASHGLPMPVCEWSFLPDRKFRFDYAWPDWKLAIEQNGQIWKKGAHSSGVGLLRDYEKLNLAQLAGWKVLQYTPEQLLLASTMDTLRTLLVR